jgi:hypothetical protein
MTVSIFLRFTLINYLVFVVVHQLRLFYDHYFVEERSPAVGCIFFSLFRGRKSISRRVI